MKKKHEALLKVLSDAAQPISSRQLANQLQVTSRSIKNYVTELNELFPNLIFSNAKGYTLCRTAQLKTVLNHIPQTFQERSSYIIRQFFINHERSIDIYKLCDELYISYSSVKLLLNRMNQEYQQANISFRCRNDEIYVEGNERDKRKFVTNVIYQESNGRFVDLSVLKDIFFYLDIDYLHTLLQTSFKSFNYYINDFGYINLSLHLTIILDRILNGNTLDHSQMDRNYEYHEVCNLIITQLEQHFQIHFSPNERHEINELIDTNLCLCLANNQQELKDIVGAEIYNITHSLIDSINRQYDLSLNQDTLLFPLALHFKNLFARYENNTYLKNPLLDTIQNSCPMLFDCAIFISNYLENEYHIQITNDEIAYLAMHIGAEVERQNKEHKKLKCILLCPDYHNNRSELYHHLLIHFDSQITITATYSYEDEIPPTPFDILFTTIQPKQAYQHVVVIPPLKSAVDLKTVFNRIQEILDRKKLQTLSQHCGKFFHEDLFYRHQSIEESKDEVIFQLYKKLKAMDFVRPSFFDDVMKREAAASTSFGQVAIPHSMKMDAKHTAIALALSSAGIPWNHHLVHVVLLVAINEAESHLFRELYEGLILLFSQDDVLDQIQACTSFEAFMQVLQTYTN